MRTNPSYLKGHLRKAKALDRLGRSADAVAAAKEGIEKVTLVD